VRSAACAFGLGATLCVLGGGFGAAALYVPGAALMFLAVGAVSYVRAATSGVRVVRSVGGSVVEEQAEVPITLSLSRSRVPAFGAEVEAWPGGPVLALPASGSSAVAATVRFPRRGRHVLGPALLRIADPLGLCSESIGSDPDELLVLPRVESLRLVHVDGAGASIGRLVRATGDALATEVDGLQPHRPGTPASRIHWPTVARSTTLMERRLVAHGEHAPLVVVDPRDPSSPDGLDQAMRAAASLCVHLARRGGCALLLPGDRGPLHLDPSLAGFAQAHARLALLQPEAGAPPVGRVTGARAVFWVAAADGRARALEALRATVRYLVSPHRERPWPVQFTVAGCSGQRLEPQVAPSEALLVSPPTGAAHER
jgi:uncharacterized protein (DUF58 family)